MGSLIFVNHFHLLLIHSVDGFFYVLYLLLLLLGNLIVHLDYRFILLPLLLLLGEEVSTVGLSLLFSFFIPMSNTKDASDYAAAHAETSHQPPEPDEIGVAGSHVVTIF